MTGLVGELRRRGLQVEVNRISGETPVCLFNSFNFDDRRLRLSVSVFNNHSDLDRLLSALKSA